MKKKALVLAVCMAFSAPAISTAKSLQNDVAGLNLGEIESKSFLNEKFEGIIPILFASNSQAKQLSVRLAPQSIHNQIGVDYSPALRNLKFEVSLHKNKPVIKITSFRNIHLPFLNFILEIQNEQGALYQDYTVMLDPRNITNSQEITSTASHSNIDLPVLHASKKIPKNYKVKSGDSLSKIAQKFKVNKFSLNRTMEAIHVKNPSAFIANDINRIRKGAILSLPTPKELKSTANIAKKSSEKVDKTLKTKNVETKPSSDNTYTVKSGDTLFGITKKFKKDGVSFTKMMSAIHSANPHAFSKNRKNVLKTNALLEIPSFDSDNKIVATKDTTKSPIEKTDSVTQEATKEESKVENLESDTLATLDESKDNNEVSTSKELETIAQAKLANTEIIERLERRVRELRSEVSQTDEKNSSLEISLSLKETLLLNQQKEINQLKGALNTAQIKTESGNEDEVLLTTENQTEEVKSEGNAESDISSLITPITETKTETASIQPELKNTGYIPKNINKISENWLNEQVAYIKSNISTKDLSFGAMALILGLLLIRYRKELYSYTKISKEYPAFYPSEAGSKDTKKKSIDYKDTLVPAEYSTDKSNKAGFDESHIQQCEVLIDELLEELEEHPESGSNKKPIISSISDQELEMMKDDKAIESINLYQEILEDAKIDDSKQAINDILNNLTDSNSPDNEHIDDNLESFMRNILPEKDDSFDINSKTPIRKSSLG